MTTAHTPATANNASLTSSAAAAAVVSGGPFDPTKVKVVKQVSTNLLKLRPGMTIYVLITGKMEIAKELKRQPKDVEKNKEPPTLVPCVNLETGQVVSVIAGAVLKDLLNDEYPKDAYVSRKFAISVLEQKDAKAGGGRRYNNYDVKEIQA